LEVILINKSNNWHEDMYDKVYANLTINSNKWIQNSQKETHFLISLLDLPPGSKWLDIPCGNGRHLTELAKKGYLTTGIDINSYCLNLAKENSPKSEILLGNMLDLNKHISSFDVVSNLFNSFGYFSDDQENYKCLTELVKALKVGGKLIINNVNRTNLLTNFEPVSWHETEDYEFISANKFDFDSNYNESKYVIIDKKSGFGKSYYSRIRYYTKYEMVELMNKAGLINIEIFGDFSGNTFDEDNSEWPIYIGTKS